MPTSRDKILTSALDCFFQHGYSAANISMISRYADISRVTIHKQFKSKEDLFRSVVESYIQSNQEKLNTFSDSTGDFWFEAQELTIDRCRGLFDEITSSVIRTDLLHAGQSYCSDIIQANEQLVRGILTQRILTEIENDRMTLAKIDISAEQLARLIESAPLGLALSSEGESNQAFVQQLMKVFKASTTL